MPARTNSSWAPRGPRNRSRPSFRMRFKWANRISIFLRSRRDCSNASVSAKGVFMDVARDPAKRDLRAAQRFELAAVAIMLPRQIEQRGSIIHQCSGCRQGLTRRAVVDIACRIISKVAAREGAIISLRPVEHRDMWRDTLLLDQPVQH